MSEARPSQSVGSGGRFKKGDEGLRLNWVGVSKYSLKRIDEHPNK